MSTSKWSLDPTHSELGFKIRHLMITNVTGHFTKFDVAVEAPGGSFANGVINATIDVASINTNNAQRDEHLRNADFFEVDKYPHIRFSSTGVEQTDDQTFQITGNLTLKETTKPVTIIAEYSGLTKDPWGNTRAGFSLSGKLNRKDFGVNYNTALEAGGVALGEELKIIGEIQLVKEAALQPA